METDRYWRIRNRDEATRKGKVGRKYNELKRDKKEKVKRNRSREKTDSDECDIFVMSIYLMNDICKNCLYIDVERNSEMIYDHYAHSIDEL